MRVDMRPMWHSDSSGRLSTRWLPAGGSSTPEWTPWKGIDAVRTRIVTLVLVICAAAWVSAGWSTARGGLAQVRRDRRQRDRSAASMRVARQMLSSRPFPFLFVLMLGDNL